MKSDLKLDYFGIALALSRKQAAELLPPAVPKPWAEVPLTAPTPRPGQSDEDAIAEDEIANGCR